MKIWGEKVPGPIAPKNAFVGLSFARLCRLPQQELCQTNKEKNISDVTFCSSELLYR